MKMESVLCVCTAYMNDFVFFSFRLYVNQVIAYNIRNKRINRV